MNADFAKYRNKKIFVDANAFIYHLIGVCRVSREIFRLGEEEKLGLITTTRIIEEVIHKIVLIKAREKFGIVSKTMPKLRRDTEKVKIMAAETKPVFRLIQAIHLSIEVVSYRDLMKIQEVMAAQGLMGNDALIYIVMNKFNLKYLLSADSDFKAIEGISVIACQPDFSGTD